MKYLCPLLVIFMVSCSYDIDRSDLFSQEKYSTHSEIHRVAFGTINKLNTWENIDLTYVDVKSLDTVTRSFPLLDNFAKNNKTKYILNKKYQIYHCRGNVMREKASFYNQKEDDEYLIILGQCYSLDSLIKYCFVSTDKISTPYLDFINARKIFFNKKIFLVISAEYRLYLTGRNNNFYIFFDITSIKEIKVYIFRDSGDDRFLAFNHYHIDHNFGYLEENIENDTLWYYTLEETGWQRQPYYIISENLSMLFSN